MPIGSYQNPTICDEAALRACHAALNEVDVTIVERDFRALSVQDMDESDFVYFDPPYRPLADNSFTRYAKDDFGLLEQTALRDLCLELHERRVKFMLSNSASAEELYRGIPGFTVEPVQAPRFVNSNASGRGKVNELLVRNYKGVG